VGSDLPTLIGQRFISRKDVKAVQNSDGSYMPDRHPWKMDDLRAHIAGTKTFGHYLVDQNNMTKLFAFDIDLVKGNDKNPTPGYWFDLDDQSEVDLGVVPCDPRAVWLEKDHPGRKWLTLQLRCCAEALALKAKTLFEDDLHIAMAYSGGKGLHVYGFFPEPVEASFARKSAVNILKAFNRPDGRPGFEPSRGTNFWVSTQEKQHNYEIEVYPKQDSLEGKDLGNLLRLPLGVNRKTGQKGFFLDGRSQLYEFKMMDPTSVLSGELPWDDW